jgi:CDGSH-type Zn-finger protein
LGGNEHRCHIELQKKSLTVVRRPESIVIEDVEFLITKEDGGQHGRKQEILKPRIIPLPNGPYYPFTRFEPKRIAGIPTCKGDEPSNVPAVARCRCGGSENKPFCRGTHWYIPIHDANCTCRQLATRSIDNSVWGDRPQVYIKIGFFSLQQTFFVVRRYGNTKPDYEEVERT